MFAVFLGLSIDDEVLHISQARLHHMGGESARRAVVSGLTSSAGRQLLATPIS
jgi:hypothetical protein